MTATIYSHITVGTSDLARATKFYDAILAPLGLERRGNFPTGIGYGAKDQPGGRLPFWVVVPLDGKQATAGNGITVGLAAENRAAVDRFHAAALSAGGTDEGAPGLRPHYHPNYYGAYVRDPDGNKICAVCHTPPAA